METLEEVESLIEQAIVPGYRHRLVAQGLSRAMIWRNGRLPPGSPAYAPTLTEDLLGHGFSLIRLGLRSRELGGSPELTRKAFETAAESIEATVKNGRLAARERGFHRICAAAYHLAGYSARAYSLMRDHLGVANLAPTETALALLMLRALDQLRLYIRQWLESNDNRDTTIRDRLADPDDDFSADDALAVALTANFLRALSVFDHALRTGDPEIKHLAINLMKRGADTANRLGTVTIWWVSALAQHLLDDLWDHSLHQRLPRDGDNGGSQTYDRLRQLFIELLYARRAAEIELWPSQLEAAARSLDVSDDLVCALPTSAGKTRIAELAILRTVSLDRRVIVVTPLRALSAQTEQSLRATFAPLGFSVSSLYGAAGATDGDVDTLANRDVVIATPEKLDFALRNDPNLINDVGLVVFDEGHLIGPSDREIRYEVLVQRLLRRADAADRRIVCLSAILPDGQELDDFVAWLRQDAAGAPVKSTWRPTRQRFGEILWRGDHARLNMRVDQEPTFIARLVEARSPVAKTRRRNPFPHTQSELVLAAAWRFVDEGQRVLIYCSQRRSVEPLAECILTLERQKLLTSLLQGSPEVLREAETIGGEWLGADHPAVRCLRMGVAVHHGKLPRPFLRAVENLLKDGVLRVTISSPTLAQGLNLSAGTLLVPNLYRRQNTLISGEEFANVAGRAGRAYVDIEGQIFHVLYEPDNYKIRMWRQLVKSARTRTIESGLFTLVNLLIDQLDPDIFNKPDVVEYLVNTPDAWAGVAEQHGGLSVQELINSLDGALLALVDPIDSTADEVPGLLDQALQQSLWSRRLARLDPDGQELHKAILFGRAGLIWSTTTGRQRQGYFAAGLGTAAGSFLDDHAETLNGLLASADLAVSDGNGSTLTQALSDFAEIVFRMDPFKPNHVLDEHRRVLGGWLAGEDVQSLIALAGPAVCSFIEDALTYRLVWALEAVRVRGLVHGDFDSNNLAGSAAMAVETGMPNIAAALLVQCGLSSRVAALKAVSEAGGNFTDIAGMRQWLTADTVERFSNQNSWPTSSTAELWRIFRRTQNQGVSAWATRELRLRVSWLRGGKPPSSPNRLHVVHDDDGAAWVYSAEMVREGRIDRPFPHRPAGLMQVIRVDDSSIEVRYTGPQLDRSVI